MNLNFLPKTVNEALKAVNMDNLFELRLRINSPVTANYGGKMAFLSQNGITLSKDNAIIIDKNDIDRLINTVTEFSVYSFNEQIKCGFLTSKDGVRIGLAGECVYSNGKIVTIRNVTSLNVRIPHNVINCSEKIFKYVYDNRKVFNALIVSKPGYGKTTILKDLIAKITGVIRLNVLLIDERAELSVGLDNTFVDVIKYSDKMYAFEYGIRSLSPNIVITDEIASKEDWQCVVNAVNSGLNIIASCHGNTLDELINKEFFKNIFDRYVFLKGEESVGEINAVYDKSFGRIND